MIPPARLQSHSPVGSPLKLIAPVNCVESPSLTSPGTAAPAYELKFLLSEQQAEDVHRRLAEHMLPDVHADAARGHSYETTSLYCDTPEFHVFHRIGSCKRRKHRLRRYGDSPSIFLERKMKWGDRVKKRRSQVPDADLALFAMPLSATYWPGHWFHRQLQNRQLIPVCTVTYNRIALVGHSADGPLRLTFDRNIRGQLTQDWNVAAVDDGHQVLSDQVICEFKYQRFLPAIFKEVIHDLRLTPTPVSKYRTMLRAIGHA